MSTGTIKVLFITIFIFATHFLFSQVITPKYTSLVKKADNYYRLKNYKASASTFSLAFKSIGWKGLPDDRYNAACVWALAKIPDSAFFQLNIIVTKGNYTNFEQISTDHDLSSLHKDKRWKPLLEKIKLNIAQKEAKLNKPLIKELDSIFDEDQQSRLKIKDVKENYGYDSKEMKDLWKTINEKDSTNLLKIKSTIDSYGWLGPDVIGEKGSSTLFLVIQHSDLKTQEKYLPLMREAVKNGNARAGSLALLEDRVAMRQGKKQIYGSQIITDSRTGKDTIAPIEDFANVDKRRAEVGLEPLQEYVSQWGIVLQKKTDLAQSSIRLISNDFNTAEEIRDSIVGPVNVSKGHGLTLDFAYGGGFKEDNSAWFKFTFDRDTILTFDIVPNYRHDDYDFIVFKCPNADCINGIRSKKVKPDRWCFSVNFDKNGSTGLSEYASDSHLGGGPGLGYASALSVKAGETVYLMINFPAYYNRPSKGFTLYLYNYWPNKPKALKAKKYNPAKAAIVLANVLFESNKTSLVKESTASLDKLVNQLQTNKSMKIEIRGHTDNTGDEKVNQKLSEGRAKAIVDYLVLKNIDKSRLSSIGFGSKKPIASNDTEEGRQKNRRVEFIILSK